MSQNIFVILQDNDVQKQWGNIYQLHQITKKYLLIAEEVCTDGVALIQPLKEHRDAYDHVVRTFASTCKEVKDGVDYRSYVIENLNKAYSHEYRAFYDTADWLAYNLRKELRIKIEQIPYFKRRKEIESYDEVAKKLNEYPFKGASLRDEKDVTSETAANGLKEYISYLEEIIELYKSITV